MKKIILIFSLMLIAYSLELYAQPSYDSVAAFTDKSTIGITDITPFQTKVANKYKWRKITGANLWNQITDTTEARITALLNASNSWNGINNFDGATFNSGSHGGVLFNGDSVTCTTQMFTHGIQRTQASSIIGRNTAPFFNVYARTFTVINAGGTDSATISIDADGNLTIPNLSVTEKITIDSSATFDVFAYTPHSYTIPNVGDTILTLTPTNRYSFIVLDLPGNMSPGISQIFVEGAQKGMVLRFFNEDASYTMEFEDYVGSDDNLYMAGDFTSMGLYDFIEFQCVAASNEGATQIWIETGRSNN